jgi:hypothetical protein
MSSDSNSDNDYSDNDGRNAEEVGDEKRRSAVMVDELVFFGRLETRKGVVEFCDAVDILLKNETVASMISKITFLGRAASVLGQNGHEYVRERAKKWTNTPWRIETRFGSKEAKAYLKSPAANRKGNKRKLAVLPSLIENSPYAVYECAEFSIREGNTANFLLFPFLFAAGLFKYAFASLLPNLVSIRHGVFVHFFALSLTYS